MTMSDITQTQLAKIEELLDLTDTSAVELLADLGKKDIVIVREFCLDMLTENEGSAAIEMLEKQRLAIFKTL